MNSKLRKFLHLLLAGALLFGVSRVQTSLNSDRDKLGLTRVTPLENAPPMLAFTTVALGGFRGLISNVLWIRASDLQDQDKFFEMAQLADWITKLEPHYVQVWIVQAWNMSYNISVKFKDFPDRWRWVKRGIELLRDQGLKYNPNETLLYRELAWHFQHKMGQNLDDASMTYKQEWANEMAVVFDKKKPNLDELIHPQTEDERKRAALLRDKYKMDPAFMKAVDEQYGPLEWRLPESHAVYWAALGLKKARENPTTIKPDELITLRRVIYQSMQTSFQRGRLVANPFLQRFEFGPNLDIIPKVNDAYEEMARDDEQMRDNITRGHRNFLRDAVYFLYSHNRLTDAAKWYKYLGEKYPSYPLLDNRPETLPSTLTLDGYAVARLQEDVKETSRDRIKNAIESLLVNSYLSLVIDEDERAAGFKLLARQVYNTYQSQLIQDRLAALTMPPLPEIDQEVQMRLLNPEEGAPPEVRAIIRTKLGLPAESTNAPPASNSITNAPAANPPTK
jgi:hypothetical protein